MRGSTVYMECHKPDVETDPLPHLVLPLLGGGRVRTYPVHRQLCGSNCACREKEEEWQDGNSICKVAMMTVYV